jgi:hypothetical protein
MDGSAYGRSPFAAQGFADDLLRERVRCVRDGSGTCWHDAPPTVLLVTGARPAYSSLM